MSYALPWNNLGVFSYGGLGAVRPDVYPALSTITWTNDSLPNSFSVTNEELHTKIVTYLNMHLAILPGSLSVNISTNWNFSTQTVTISFSLFQDTAEQDLRFGVLQSVDLAYGLAGTNDSSGDWGTFSYQAPPSGSSQAAATIPDITNAVSSGLASDAGIVSAGSFPDGTTYVALSDGNVISFDNQGNPLGGIPYGAYSVAFAIAYDDGTTGVVMVDGTEYLFNPSGTQVKSQGSGQTAYLANDAYNKLQTIAQKTGLEKTAPKPDKSVSAQGILESLGFGNIPTALGVTSGIVLVGLGVAAYVVLSKK